MSKHQVGLIFGLFLAIVHAVWSLLIAVMPVAVQSFINWVFVLHHISMPIAIIGPFSLMNAIILVILSFVIGYVIGWFFTWLSRWTVKK